MSWLPLVWAIIGLVFVGAEFILPGLVIIFFGIGALITAAVSALLPPVAASILLQTLTWIGSSVVTLAVLRRRFARVFRGTLLNEPEEDLVGKRAEVTAPVGPDQPGRIRLQGTTWKAITYDEMNFQPGDPVDVIKQEGATLIVTQPIMIEEDP